MTGPPWLHQLEGNRRWPAALALSVLLAAAYFVAGRLGLGLATGNPSTTTVWAPAGIALGALLLWGYRVWPGVLLGAFLVYLTTTANAGAALGMALGNTLEGVLALYLVHRFARGTDVFNRLSDILKFVLLAALLSTTLAAGVGVASLALAGLATPGRLDAMWLTWWVGDASGVLLFAPVLVLWAVAPPLEWTRQRVLEALAIALCALLVNLMVFGGLFAPVLSSQELEVLCILPVLWAAFRLGARAPLAAAFVSSRIAIWGTLQGHGPFLSGDLGESLVLAQVYSAVVSVLALMLVAIVAERRRADATHEQLLQREQAARAEAETARKRLALLAEAGSVLSSSLDYRATLARLAHLLVPRHGDWCALHIIDDNAVPRQLEVAHADPARLELVEELNRRYPTDPLVPGGLAHVIQAGRSEYMTEIPQPLLLAAARDAEHERLLRVLGLRSYMIVPLKARQKVLGAISLASAESGRRYDAADVALIEELAQRAALAIDNARLYGAAQQTNAELEERVQGRTAQLQAANRLLETEIAERTRAQTVLQESEDRFRLLVANVVDYAIYMLDPVGRVMSWNEGAQRIKGYTADEVLGRNFAIFYLPEDAANGLPARMLQRAARSGRAEDEGWRVRKDGTRFWAEVVLTALRDARGELHGFSKVTHDSTERKRAAEALQQVNEALERRVQERTLELETANRRLGDGIDDLMERNRAVGQLSEMGTLLQGCLDEAEAYRVISQFGPRLFPLDAGALYLFTPARDLLEPAAAWGDDHLAQQVFVPNDCWALRRGHMHVVQSGTASPLCAHLNGQAEPHGSYACVPLSAQGETLGVLHLRRGAGRGAARPITEAEQHLMGAMVEQTALALSNLRLRATLRVQSIRDPLTGLFNRRYMEETLEREIHHAARQHQPIGIAMLDIDRFKQFNDRFGHQVGDIVLRAVGDFLNANVRGEDIACRYGGEEFMLILQEASLEDTRKRAEQLRVDIKRAVGEHYRERFGALSVSVGIAAFPEHGTTIEKLVRAADSALYRAKAAGRDRVVASAGQE